jgi:pimeloyl-ACP methyl ester carboxylesterase
MTQPHDRRITVNGIGLNVSDWGGSGRDVLFAHPTGFLGAIWRPIIERLRAAGFDGRVVSYDARGHGRSAKPDSGYEWGTFVADARALIEELGLKAVLGVGHSAGSTTLACAAAEDPARFRSLVMIDPILFDSETARAMHGIENPMAARTRTRRLVWSSRSELFASFRHRAPYETWTDEALQAYVDEGTFERPDGEIELWCPGRIEAQIYENAASFPCFDYLRRIVTPVLLVRGEHSGSFPERRARLALDAIAGARLLTIEGTDHYLPMEQPDRVADLILAELDA